MFVRLIGVVIKDIDLEIIKGDVGGDFVLFGFWILREVFEGNVIILNLERKEYIMVDGELV